MSENIGARRLHTGDGVFELNDYLFDVPEIPIRANFENQVIHERKLVEDRLSSSREKSEIFLIHTLNQGHLGRCPFCGMAKSTSILQDTAKD